jgi:hypothetical protein
VSIKVFQPTVSFLLFIVGSFLVVVEVLAVPPYPQSRVITDITWAPASTIVSKAGGSDNWPITWADDDNLYTAWGDGHGFSSSTPRLSLGLAKVMGTAEAFSGDNIRSPTGEQWGDGDAGKKASGMLMVDNVLYMWVRNADNAGKQCQLAWSNDYAVSWTWSSWKFAELGYCAFSNFGKNYAAARDNYVYMYSPDTPSAYLETDHVVLTRVPKTQITNRNSYEFFAGLDTDNNPIWTVDIDQRKSVFTFPGGSNRLDVTYSVALGRYLMTMRSRARAGGLNQFSIYDSPEPWGPWTTVYYTEEWEGGSLSTTNGGWGEIQHIPSKWISADGKTFYLVFAGNDSFSVRKADLTVSTSGAVPLPPTNLTVQ